MLGFYDPKGDGYNRLLGNMNGSSFAVIFDEFSTKKISDNELVVYGIAESFDKAGLYKKGEKDWELPSGTLIKLSLHKDTWKNFDEEKKPEAHEKFFFDALSALDESKSYIGRMFFSPGMEGIYSAIDPKDIVGSDNKVVQSVATIEVLNEKTIKPPSGGVSGNGGGKTYKSEFQKVTEKYPNFFKGQEVKSVEDCIDAALKGWKYGNWKPSSGMKRDDEYRNKSLIVFCGLTSTPVPLEMLKDASTWNGEPEEQEEMILKVDTGTQETNDISDEDTELLSKDIGGDFSSWLALSNRLIKRLGITQEEGKGMIEREFGKTQRTKLTDDEYQKFIAILQDELAKELQENCGF